MKKSTKIIRLSVTLLLLIAMLLTPMSPVFAVVIENGDADLTAADIVSEDASKREKFSRHYLTGDGTYFAVSYAEQVNYQDEDGNWIAVDNSLSTNVLTGEKTTKNDKFKVKFANKANKDDLVTIKTSEYDVSFGITVSEDGESYLELNKVKGTESASNTSAEPKTTQEATSLGKAVSGITYVDAFSDYLDVRYSVAHEKVKEDLILERKSGFNSYKVTYNIKEKDALATLNDDGSITFTNPDGAVLFNVGVPVMYDSEGKTSADIAVSMVQTKKTVEVTYTPASEWLNAEERVYPVTIDPEIQSGTESWYYESLLDYSNDEPHEVDLTNSSYISISSSQIYYLWLTAPTLPDNANFLYSEYVMFSSANNGTIGVERITSAWFPGEMIYPDGSTAIPNSGNAFSISINEEISNYRGTYNDTPVYDIKINIPYNDITSYGGYSNYFGDTFYGHRFTGLSDTVLEIYTSGCEVSIYRPCIALAYSYSPISPLSNGGYYFIRNTITGEYLTINGEVSDVTQGSTLSLAPLRQELDSTRRLQIFRVLFDAEENLYSITYPLNPGEITSDYKYIGTQTSYLNGTTFTSHNATIRNAEFCWEFYASGYNNFTLHANINNQAVLSVDTNGNVIVTNNSFSDTSKHWEFIPIDSINNVQTIPDIKTAVLLTVKNYLSTDFDGYARSVIPCLNFNKVPIVKHDDPKTSILEDEVVDLLEIADIMVISSHADKDSILLQNNEFGNAFELDEFDNYPDLDLSHIELLVLLSCSNAYIDDTYSNTYSYQNRNVITSASWGPNGPRNILEKFVDLGVQTVIGFNQTVYVDESDNFIADLFQCLVDYPFTDSSSVSTANSNINDVIRILSTQTDVYGNNSTILSKLVIGGRDDLSIYQGGTE